MAYYAENGHCESESKLWQFDVARCRSVRNIGQKSDQSTDLVPF